MKEHSVSYASSLRALDRQDSRIHSVHLCCVWARGIPGLESRTLVDGKAGNMVIRMTLTYVND